MYDGNNLCYYPPTYATLMSCEIVPRDIYRNQEIWICSHAYATTSGRTIHFFHIKNWDKVALYPLTILVETKENSGTAPSACHTYSSLFVAVSLKPFI